MYASSISPQRWCWYRRLVLATAAAALLLPWYAGSGVQWALVKYAIRLCFPSIKPLSTTELDAWLRRADQSALVLLDTRESEEYAVSHLRSAQLAPTTEAALQVLRTTPKDQPVVLYCSVGYRSSKLAEQLQRAGYQHVYNLDGSIFQWANEGRPLYSGEADVQAVHPYDKRWGRLLRPELHAR